MKVYDFFAFFNELDILEIRLETLGPQVERFFLLEADITKTNQPKARYFETHSRRFQKWWSKIEHIPMTAAEFPNLPEPDPEDRNEQRKQAQIRQKAQFDKLNQYVPAGNPDDVIVCLDVDCIPDFRIGIEEISRKPTMCVMANHGFYLNYWSPRNAALGTAIARYKDYARYNGLFDFTYYNRGRFRRLKNGWHFTFMNSGAPGEDRFAAIRRKLDAYCHQEKNLQEWKTEKMLQKCLNDGWMPFHHTPEPYCYQKVPFDNRFPEYLQRNWRRYPQLVKE